METPLLGELELAVMEHLWSAGTTDAKALHAAIGARRGITLSTIQSTLERLHRKRLLIRERLGHAFRYAPALGRAEFRARSMREAAGDLRAPDADAVLAAFVELVARADARAVERLAELASARARRGG